MPMKILSESRWLGVQYKPQPETRSFVDRARHRNDEEVTVSASVLDDRESELFFGIPLAHRGIQPIWLQVRNNGKESYRLHLGSLDPNYYSPLEAAYVSRFATGKRLAGFGLLAWFFFPLLIFMPLKYLGARAANRRMNAYFQEHGIGWGLIRPGTEVSGFVFTSLDRGTKEFPVKLLGSGRAKQFFFSIPVPGLKVDHGHRRFDEYYRSDETLVCDESMLRKQLEALPRSTTNTRGTVEGDPLNLVVIGDFDTIRTAFGARWDDTEKIGLRSCWLTIKSFLIGTRYRYCPVSSLHFQGRSQDFALQRTRRQINERLHLRLWITPLVFMGKPVWVGQISRDIGVRFTPKTWNLTTHKIDPDVDDARDYVLGDLMEAGRVSHVTYVGGVEAADRNAPRRNLTGDPYFTDGLRAVAVVSENRTDPNILSWS
ncbi:MAG: LssY C-terminal domain-containing protein [Desulfomonilaceae bacterium]|nr:LssY C-terminal domain-containing protein [Desulfomonilaceae bacterium]